MELTDEKKKNDAKALIELRNNIALGMAMINLLWIAINFMFQFESPTSIDLPTSVSILCHIKIIAFHNAEIKLQYSLIIMLTF